MKLEKLVYRPRVLVCISVDTLSVGDFINRPVCCTRSNSNTSKVKKQENEMLIGISYYIRLKNIIFCVNTIGAAFSAMNTFA
jgi:hypothetical protein